MKMRIERFTQVHVVKNSRVWECSSMIEAMTVVDWHIATPTEKAGILLDGILEEIADRIVTPRNRKVN